MDVRYSYYRRLLITMSDEGHTDKKSSSFSTPTAIVIAGVLVAGSILAKDYVFKKSGTITPPPSPSEAKPSAENPQVQGEQTTGTKVAIPDLVKQVGLNQGDFDACFNSTKYDAQIKADQEAAQKAEVDGTPSYFINGRLLVGAQPYSEFKKIIEEELSGKRSSPSSDKAPTASDNDAIKGDKNAPVTVIIFSDFLCPYCGAAAGFRESDVQASLKSNSPGWEAPEAGLLKDYVDNGKVKVVFKGLPFHGEPALKLTKASLCAKDQGKYWEMHDAIFSNQASLEVQ